MYSSTGNYSSASIIYSEEKQRRYPEERKYPERARPSLILEDRNARVQPEERQTKSSQAQQEAGKQHVLSGQSA